MSVIRWNDLEESQMPSVSGSVMRKFVSGEKMTLARVEFSKGAVTEPHKHVNEQYSLVLSGRMEFMVEGQPVVVAEGEIIHLPSEKMHGARAIEPSVIMDIFAPPRSDWPKQ